MKLIEELHVLIKSIKEENLDSLNFIQRLEKLRKHSQQFDGLIEEWIKKSQLDQPVPFIEIRSIINAEIKEMERSFTRRPSKKLPNLYHELLGWKKKLNSLKYEIDKKNYLGEDTSCYCTLRIINRIQPDFTALSDYGRAILYYEDDNYVIKQCNYCNTMWINDDSYGSSRGWHRWNPEEFLIREVFENE